MVQGKWFFYTEQLDDVKTVLHSVYGSEPELTDDDLLEFMKEAFDGECEGDLEYLEDTALEEFARSIRREGKSFLGKHYRIKGRGYEDDEL